MPSYIAIRHTAAPEGLSPLVALVEALLNRPTSAGVTIRNVAVVPRTGRLYIHVDAPSAALVADLFDTRGREPVSVVEADGVAWHRLIRRPTELLDRPGGAYTTARLRSPISRCRSQCSVAR